MNPIRLCPKCKKIFTDCEFCPTDGAKLDALGMDASVWNNMSEEAQEQVLAQFAPDAVASKGSVFDKFKSKLKNRDTENFIPKAKEKKQEKTSTSAVLKLFPIIAVIFSFLIAYVGMFIGSVSYDAQSVMYNYGMDILSIVWFVFFFAVTFAVSYTIWQLLKSNKELEKNVARLRKEVKELKKQKSFEPEATVSPVQTAVPKPIENPVTESVEEPIVQKPKSEPIKTFREEPKRKPQKQEKQVKKEAVFKEGTSPKQNKPQKEAEPIEDPVEIEEVPVTTSGNSVPTSAILGKNFSTRFAETPSKQPEKSTAKKAEEKKAEPVTKVKETPQKVEKKQEPEKLDFEIPDISMEEIEQSLNDDMPDMLKDDIPDIPDEPDVPDVIEPPDIKEEPVKEPQSYTIKSSGAQVELREIPAQEPEKVPEPVKEEKVEKKPKLRRRSTATGKKRSSKTKTIEQRSLLDDLDDE